MRRSLVLILVTAAALALAGCTGKTDTPPASPSAPANPAPANGAGSSTSSSGSSLPPPTVPSGFQLKDAGDIQGPFDRTWTLHVAAVGFRDALVDFNLSAFQDGAPPTAVIHLSLQDAQGHEIKADTVGLGQSANSIAWKLTPADLPHAGDYQLHATSEPGPVALPSGGLAHFALYGAVTY